VVLAAVNLSLTHTTSLLTMTKVYSYRRAHGGERKNGVFVTEGGVE
jgi:hypothetical protein